ncbi:polynucleotide adenylyltransferase PcnB [Nitrosomonadales bacterium]|nr:polynucleotide adenylyltransferase PcnB [Nitrosomonadales bacterium]
MNSNLLQVFQEKIHSFFKSKRINHELITDAALDTVKMLKKNNYDAFIVGGAIRDILMGFKPKDFDIATNATPEQVRTIFKKSRIIGRRFRLVHVIYGREIIEVSTFRARPLKKIQMSNGVLKDNEYGTINEDAERRDFTINALYYDIENKNIIDFYGGLRDIQNNQLRLIGEPKLRYKEDPIRILRAIRFSSKLKMEIHNKTLNEIRNSIGLLKSVPYSRLFDEVMKFFLTGHSQESMVLFKKYNLSSTYFPSLENDNKIFNDFLLQALINTDLRIKNGKSINPGFLLAVFLWDDVNELCKKYKKKFPHPSLALNKAIDEVLQKQARIFPVQKRFSITMSEIWRLQIRFNSSSSKKIYRLLNHPRFRASYDFLLLRCQALEISRSEGLWWTKFIESSKKTQDLLIANKKNWNNE